MNYFITGGTGFIGTHLTNLLQELHPGCNVYNLDIVEPGTPLPSVKVVLGLTKEECDEKFGFLIEAFKYGAPPHAGLAYGLDRFVMLLLGEPSIREVIAFPKNQNAQCLVSSAPSPVDQAQLDELGITTK